MAYACLFIRVVPTLLIYKQTAKLWHPASALLASADKVFRHVVVCLKSAATRLTWNANLLVGSCSNPEVKTFALFIGSLGNQAAALARELPAGRSFVCLDVSKMPKIMKQVFASVLVNKMK